MIWALLGALLVGGSLGLLGSGGSILTVPVLTFLVGQEEKVAIAGSLAIVGTIAAVAAVPNALRGEVDGRSVVFFGLPGMAGAYLGAWASQFVAGEVQMAAFAVLMLVAAVFMLRPRAESRGDAAPRSIPFIAAEGLVVGAVTGFVGVGGGFLIVPALVLLGGLPMQRAVGTSLAIIALKSATGFVKYLDVLEAEGLALDWGVLAMFSVVGVAGSLGGSRFGARLSQVTLQRAFGLFLIAIGVLLVAQSWTDLTAGGA